MRQSWSIMIGVSLVGLGAWQAVSVAREPRKAKPPVRSLPPKEFDRQTREIFDGQSLKRLAGKRPTKSHKAGSSNQTITDSAVEADTTFAWSKVISPETVVDEIKSYRTELAKSVRTPGTFRSGGNREARQHMTMIAAMFGVMGEYDGDVRWKKQARGARDVFAAAGRNAKAADANTFKESKQRSEDLDELVRGGSVDFEAAETSLKWHHVAERPPLMKRMEMAVDKRLRKWTANKGEFSRNRDQAIHEAEIVAALAEVIQREEYEFFDDDDYLEMCRELVKQAQLTTSAVRENNFEEAQRAVGSMTKSCSACHEGYR